MEHHQDPSTPSNPTSQPSEPPPPHPPPPSSSPSTPLPHSPITNPGPSPNPNSALNPNPNAPSRPLMPLQNQPQSTTTRPPSTSARNWQPPSHFSHFSSGPPTTALSSPASSSISGPPLQRGGMATGVPAHQPTPSPQPPPFSSSYGQHFGGLARTAVNVPEPSSTPNSPQVRAGVQGVQAVGMLGSMASTSQMRPGGIPTHIQQRPVQSSLRPQTSPPNSLPSSSQSFQGHGMLRVPSVASPGPSLPSTSQGLQSSNQPWLSSTSQGKPPLPPPSYRMNSPSLQQRSLISQQQLQPSQQQQHQQQHITSSSSPQQQQHMSSSSQQQQPTQSPQTQEHLGQQFQPARVSQPQALPQHQQHVTRVLGPGNQKPSTPSSSQSITSQPMAQSRQVNAEPDEPCSRILSKRTIHELVNQVDPMEKLDPEVEDVLVDLAEEFVESITTFGCSLAKHRKSNTLEAKDILLHLERNWNMSLPGFGGDDIKIYKKPHTNDIHKERLAVIKKSVATSEMANARNSAGQATGNTKGGLAKTPANVIGSPPLKIREVT